MPDERRHSVVGCAKMSEPIEMLFRLWTRVGPTKHVVGGVHTNATLVPSVCGVDAAFLSGYFDCLLLILIHRLMAAVCCTAEWHLVAVVI